MSWICPRCETENTGVCEVCGYKNNAQVNEHEYNKLKSKLNTLTKTFKSKDLRIEELESKLKNKNSKGLVVAIPWIIAFILGIIIASNIQSFNTYKYNASLVPSLNLENKNLKNQLKSISKLSNQISNLEGEKQDLAANISILKQDKSRLDSSNKALLNENYNLQSSLNSITRTNSGSKSEISFLYKEIDKYKSSIENIYKSPIIIENIDFKSTNYDGNITYIEYGAELKKSKIYYLCPRIKYKGNETKSIKLNVKIIRPNGSISKGTSSPNGFTYSSEFNCHTGSNTRALGGWGNKTGGTYESGWYQIEFWYNDICIGYKKFYVRR